MPTPGASAVAYQINPAHSGSQTDQVTPPLVQRWSRDLGAQISYPLVAGGRIFVTVGSDTPITTQLYALDEKTGATLWGTKLTANPSSIPWSGITYENGRVFALSEDGNLWAFDAATGTVLWSTSIMTSYAYVFSSPPTALGGIVYTAGAGDGGTVFAISEQNGSVLWSKPRWVENGDMSSPAVSSNGVYVSYVCNNAYDFDPKNGDLIWRHGGPCEGGGGRTSVLFGGRLYVRDNVTGNLMLDAQTGAVLGGFSAGPAPAFNGSTGFFLSGTTLEARDVVSGAVQWSFTGDGTLSSAPIVDNGYVYIGSTSGNLYALDAKTGANVWTGTLGAEVRTPTEQNLLPLPGLGAGDGFVVVPASTRLIVFQSVVNSGPPQLLLDESGSGLNQVAALDSVLLTRGPFPVVNGADLLNLGADRNTRVILFVMNIQPPQGQPAPSVVVHLVDSNNQTYDVSAEDVRLVQNLNFAQVIFRLPDNLAAGTCTITVKALGQFSNSGTIKIGN